MTVESRKREYFWITDNQLDKLVGWQHTESRYNLVKEIKKIQRNKEAEKEAGKNG